MDEPTRDSRWETVWGYIQPRSKVCIPYDEEEARLFEDLIEFRLEVVHDGMRWNNIHLVHKSDLEDSRLNPTKHILDQMVKALDNHME